MHNPELCRGCKICEVACSLYHEGICSSQLSRIHIDADDLNLIFKAELCAQCDSPSCYFACPLKDEALCINSVTGARYINVDKCIGCKMCIEACPFDPPRINFDAERNVALKCDLCKGRDGGSICVEMCPRGALTFVEGGK